MKFQHKGQAITEYTGALVVATAVVSAALAASFTPVGQLFTNIFSNVSNYILTALGKIA